MVNSQRRFKFAVLQDYTTSGGKHLKTLGTLGLGLAISTTALGQSTVTSTKTETTLPSFLKDVSLGITPYVESSFDAEGDRTGDYFSHTASISKPITDAVNVAADLYIEKTGQDDEYAAANPIVKVSASILKAGVYSLSSNLEYTPKLSEEAATTEVNLYNKVSTDINSIVSTGVQLRTTYKYQSDIAKYSDMGYYNRLSANVSVKATPKLNVGLISQVYRSVAASTGALTTTPRNILSVAYKADDKLSVGADLVTYRDAADYTKRTSSIAALNLSYTIL